MRIIGIIIAVSGFLSTNLTASPAEEAWEAYLAGNFSLVEKIFNESVTDTTLTQQEQARLYLALGCSDAMRGRDAIAATSFETALNLNPKLHLTASDLPPPVWRVFHPIQEKLSEQPIVDPVAIEDKTESNTEPSRDTVRVYLERKRDRITTLKSLLLPGWGHIAEGNPRGYYVAGSQIALTSAFIWAVIKSRQTHQDYLNSREEGDISTSYKRYNDYYRLSWGIGAAVVLGYIAAQYDFFNSMPPMDITVNDDLQGKKSVSLTCRFNLGRGS